MSRRYLLQDRNATRSPFLYPGSHNISDKGKFHKEETNGIKMTELK
jgi:hypothetical protein